MSIDLEYSNAQKILTIRVQGHLDADSFEAAAQNLVNSNEYCHNVNTIWDLRDMQFDNVDMKLMKQLIDVQKKYAERRGQAKIAILSNYSLAAPIVKLFIILSKNLRQHYRAFTSINEAEQWLCDEALKNLD